MNLRAFGSRIWPLNGAKLDCTGASAMSGDFIARIGCRIRRSCVVYAIFSKQVLSYGVYYIQLNCTKKYCAGRACDGNLGEA